MHPCFTSSNECGNLKLEMCEKSENDAKNAIQQKIFHDSLTFSNHYYLINLRTFLKKRKNQEKEKVTYLLDQDQLIKPVNMDQYLSLLLLQL